MKTLLLGLLLIAPLLFTTGCTLELPALDTPEGILYVDKCGSCHPPKHPKMITFPAWKLQVDKMEKKNDNMKIREPLTEDEAREKWIDIPLPCKFVEGDTGV